MERGWGMLLIFEVFQFLSLEEFLSSSSMSIWFLWRLCWRWWIFGLWILEKQKKVVVTPFHRAGSTRKYPQRERQNENERERESLTLQQNKGEAVSSITIMKSSHLLSLSLSLSRLFLTFQDDDFCVRGEIYFAAATATTF